MPKVAVAQIKVTPSLKNNLRKILSYIKKAKAKNADIVCFPETCLNPLSENLIDVKEQIAAIQLKCQENAIWCLVGSYVPKGRRKARNVSFLINRRGRIVYKYYKVHLWKTEKDNVLPGKNNVLSGKSTKVIKTDFGKIGLITCWDFAFPSFIQQLAKDGAKIIFCPTFLTDYKKDIKVLRRLPLVRAYDTLSYFIMCDAFREISLSESYICHPLKILAKIKNKEGLLVADLDLEKIDTLRNYYNQLEF